MEEDTYNSCEISVLIYMSPYCKYCIMAKELLDKMGMPYEAVDVNESQTKRAEMIEKTQRKTVPQIYINDLHIGGFDDLKALHDAGKLHKFKRSCSTEDLK
ncbi:MAG: glutaredoxin 3 [Alphaproteobacteria bacterium]|nr:glutaredoxin 3 [Alphaproteobacteria bacterium]